MTGMLSTGADIASILTAIVAVWAYYTYRRSLKVKRKRLERYLEDELNKDMKKRGGNTGMRSVTHLVARVGMTEADALQAAFSSGYIKSFVSAVQPMK